MQKWAGEKHGAVVDPPGGGADRRLERAEGAYELEREQKRGKNRAKRARRAHRRVKKRQNQLEGEDMSSPSEDSSAAAKSKIDE